jgi:hypothetical protein
MYRPWELFLMDIVYQCRFLYFVSSVSGHCGANCLPSKGESKGQSSLVWIFVGCLMDGEEEEKV